MNNTFISTVNESIIHLLCKKLATYKKMSKTLLLKYKDLLLFMFNITSLSLGPKLLTDQTGWI